MPRSRAEANKARRIKTLEAIARKRPRMLMLLPAPGRGDTQRQFAGRIMARQPLTDFDRWQAEQLREIADEIDAAVATRAAFEAAYPG